MLLFCDSEILALISHIHTGRAREQPVEDPKDSLPRRLLHPLQPHAPPLLIPIPAAVATSLPLPPELAEAPGFLGFLLLSVERVAPEVNLPARDAVDDAGMAVPRCTAAAATAHPGAHGAHELGIRLGPLVQVHVRGPDRDPRVSSAGILYAGRYADRAHAKAPLPAPGGEN